MSGNVKSTCSAAAEFQQTKCEHVSKLVSVLMVLTEIYFRDMGLG